MDHAGAGGESVDDGKMNTRDFDLYYKDEAGEWKLAKEVRGNKAHVSDITLDHPIKAQNGVSMSLRQITEPMASHPDLQLEDV